MSLTRIVVGVRYDTASSGTTTYDLLFATGLITRTNYDLRYAMVIRDWMYYEISRPALRYGRGHADDLRPMLHCVLCCFIESRVG